MSGKRPPTRREKLVRGLVYVAVSLELLLPCIAVIIMGPYPLAAIVMAVVAALLFAVTGGLEWRRRTKELASKAAQAKRPPDSSKSPSASG